MIATADETALLAAICAHPAEDTPRLAYADEIQERQPERAEFIRVQIELAQTENEAEAFVLDERAWRLWQENWEAWEGVPGLSDHIRRMDLIRGFIDKLIAPADWWLAHADAIRAAHPVTAVRLTTWPDSDWVVETTMGAGGPNPAYSTVHDQALRLRWPGVTFELPA